MDFVFTTHPRFLRQSFPQVRTRLEGTFQVEKNGREQLIFSRNPAEVASTSAPTPEVAPRTIWSQPVSQAPQPAVPDVVAAPQVVDNPHLKAFQSDSKPTAVPHQAKPARKPTLRHRALNAFLGLFIVSSLLVGSLILIPSLYYVVFPADTVEVLPPEQGTAFGGEFDTKTPLSQMAQKEEPYQPPVDPTLPEGTWLVIPRIGVRTQPQATVDPEEALATGVWLVPDFGMPGAQNTTPDGGKLPIILAAHRFGWKWWWQSDYWMYHSFNKLPETEPGDRIEVITNQQKWVYEIYGGEEGEEITDYSADLILYTCKFLEGPIRHFRYARLIDPTKNTQAAVQ